MSIITKAKGRDLRPIISTLLNRKKLTTIQPTAIRKNCGRCSLRSRATAAWVARPGGAVLNVCRDCWRDIGRREEIERIRKILFNSCPPPGKGAGLAPSQPERRGA